MFAADARLKRLQSAYPKALRSMSGPECSNTFPVPRTLRTCFRIMFDCSAAGQRHGAELMVGAARARPWPEERDPRRWLRCGRSRKPLVMAGFHGHGLICQRLARVVEPERIPRSQLMHAQALAVN